MATSEFYARLAWSIFCTIVHELLFYTLLFLPGLVLVPLAWSCRIQQRSPITGRWIVNAPRWLWLYGNDEDGLEPLWWAVARPEWSRFRRAWVWAAFRNPVNNLRFVRAIYAPPVVGKVQVGLHTDGGPTITMVIWQGWRHRIIFVRTEPYLWLGFGFKYELRDSNFRCDDWRANGVGFGVRLVK